MADITIQGIGEKVLVELQRDADAQGITLQDLILHILSMWEEIKSIPVHVPVENKEKLPMGTFQPVTTKWLDAFQEGVAAAERGEPCPSYPTAEEVKAAYGGKQKQDEADKPH